MMNYSGRHKAPERWRIGASGFEVFCVASASPQWYWRPVYGDHAGDEDWRGPFETDFAAYSAAIRGKV